jgi:hypothetical protein
MSLAAMFTSGATLAQSKEETVQAEVKYFVGLEAFHVFTSSQNLALAAKRQHDRAGS